jgi:holo-[acyl-carrier protein] synthase
MGVVNERSGRPVLELSGRAAEILAALTPPGMRPRIHVTLTDDHPWALAFVVIEALPMSQ